MRLAKLFSNSYYICFKLIKNGNINTQKEKRGHITSSTFLGYLQTPCVLKRVKAHAIRRELSTSILVRFIKFWRFSETRIKSGRSVLCHFYTISAHRHLLFLGFNYYFRFFPNKSECVPVLSMSNSNSSSY